MTSDFILKDPSTMENKLYRHRKGSLETRELGSDLDQFRKSCQILGLFSIYMQRVV